MTLKQVRQEKSVYLKLKSSNTAKGIVDKGAGGGSGVLYLGSVQEKEEDGAHRVLAGNTFSWTVARRIPAFGNKFL